MFYVRKLDLVEHASSLQANYDTARMQFAPFARARERGDPLIIGRPIAAWMCTCDVCGVEWMLAKFNLYWPGSESASEAEQVYWRGDPTSSQMQYGDMPDLMTAHAC